MDPSAGVFIVYMHTNQLSTETTSMCGSFSAAELGVSSVSTRLVSSVGKLISLKFLNHLLELRIFFLFTEFSLENRLDHFLGVFFPEGHQGHLASVMPTAQSSPSRTGLPKDSGVSPVQETTREVC